MIMTVYEGRKGLKQLLKAAHKGMRLYVVYTNHANYPGAPAEYYIEHVLNRRGPMSGRWMTDGGMGIQAMLGIGPVHDAPPRGIPSLTDRPTQAFAPEMVRGTWNDQLADMEKQNRLAIERAERGF